jgi:hypothetical protein
MNELFSSLEGLTAVQVFGVLTYPFWIGLLLGLGMNVATRIISPKVKKEITYDNVDK